MSPPRERQAPTTGKRKSRFPAIRRTPIPLAAEAAKCPSRVTGASPERTKEISMFLALFVILLVMWMLGFFALHVAGGLVHLLLIIAVIALLVHFFRGRSVA